MAKYVFNIFHDEEGMDVTALQNQGGLDARYVFVAGDTMTGALFVDPVIGDNAIILKAGKRLVFDG